MHVMQCLQDIEIQNLTMRFVKWAVRSILYKHNIIIFSKRNWHHVRCILDEIQRLISSLRRAEVTNDPEAMSEFSEEANKVTIYQ